MVSELRQWWKVIRTAILAVGVLFSFFALVEVLHVYVVLRDTYAPFGYAFLLLIATGFIWILIYILLSLRKRPKALPLPDIEDLSYASKVECQAYCRYIIRYLQRLVRNPNLADGDMDGARQNIVELEKHGQSDQESSVLLEKIDKVERETIEPLLSKLDVKAEAETRRCVRDIMLGVTLSPFRAVDLLIVIYRNASMVFRIMGLYNSRPPLAEQMLILRDVFWIVATVNYMNFGEKLMEQFLSRIPYIGQLLDDFAQGVGAGLLTSVAGHGAVYRCRAYKRWNQEIAVQTMSDNVKDFMGDVKEMFKQDVLPKMRNRVYSTAPIDKTADPRFWEKTMNGISSALDATETFIAFVIKKPVITGTKGTIKVGSTAMSKSKEVFNDGVDCILKGTIIVASGTGKGVRFALSKLMEATNFTGKTIKRLFTKNQ